MNELTDERPSGAERPDLEAIKARAAAATEGPWEWDDPTIGQHWSRPKPWATVVDDEVNCGGYCYGGSSSPIKSDADGRFIAHAREDIPALVAEIERLLRLLHTEADARRPEPTPEPGPDMTRNAPGPAQNRRRPTTMNTHTDRVLLVATRKSDTPGARIPGATDPVLFEWRGDAIPDQPTIDKTIEALLQLPGVVAVREKVERVHVAHGDPDPSVLPCEGHRADDKSARGIHHHTDRGGMPVSCSAVKGGACLSCKSGSPRYDDTKRPETISDLMGGER